MCLSGGQAIGHGISEKTVLHVVKKTATNMNIPLLAPRWIGRLRELAASVGVHWLSPSQLCLPLAAFNHDLWNPHTLLVFSFHMHRADRRYWSRQVEAGPLRHAKDHLAESHSAMPSKDFFVLQCPSTDGRSIL